MVTTSQLAAMGLTPGTVEYNLAAQGLSPESSTYDSTKNAALERQAFEADPANRAAVQQQSDQWNALRSAQTASMGALTGTPQFSSGVSDPSTAFQKFVQSGYSGSDAMRDGWLTGVGTPGWQNTAGYQAPLNPQGMIGAPYAQQQIQQYQSANVAAQNRNGWGAAASPSSPQINQAAQPYYSQGAGSGGQSMDFWKAQLGSSFDQNAWNMAHGGAAGQSPPTNAQPATLGPQQGMTGNYASAYGQAPQRGGIYQQLGSMLGGAGQSNPFARPVSAASAPTAPSMPMSSGVPAGGYGQRQNMLGQSPAWQSFLSNLKPGGM
jgi:hypothetical protein